MPSLDSVASENGGLPNSEFPSDHLMIAAEFGVAAEAKLVVAPLGLNHKSTQHSY